MLNDVIRVGGRLQHSTLPSHSKHQIIMPKGNTVNKFIIKEAHDVGHVGIEHVLSRVRQKFWLIRARPAIKGVLNECFICRLRWKKTESQKMADLPPDRLEADTPPFSNVGTDCFGPLYVKRRRVTVKRYGCLFTCLTIRAVHVEVLYSLDTSSFINAFQRFASRRGMPKVVRSDNATNYKGAEKEIASCFNESDSQHTLMKNYIMKNEIHWIFNTPSAPHHGGVWERQVKSVKKILTAVAGGKLLTMDDEH
ncbi:Uncharacterised protein r2_g3881 [Pycnogonum litorale]